MAGFYQRALDPGDSCARRFPIAAGGGERPDGTRPDVLRDFAEKTGGFAAVNTNDFDPA